MKRQGGFSRFASLIEGLLFSPSRNTKLALMEEYFRTAPGEDRGYALAILTGSLEIESVRAAQLRNLAQTKIDPELFRLSYAYVGDLGETIALIWPEDVGDTGAAAATADISLAELVGEVQSLTRLERFPFLDRMLDQLSERERWAFVKLVTGSSLRIGVSSRLAKQGLARAFGVDVDDIEKVWAAYQPPYEPLFAWLDGETGAPAIGHEVFFHPPMLAHNLEEKDLSALDPAEFVAEWKWDGIRVQLAGDGEGRVRLFSRAGEEISDAFPDLLEGFSSRVVLDGELLVRRENLTESTTPVLPKPMPDAAPFNDLQQRLNRKKVTPTLLAEYPAMLCLYDILYRDGCDLREGSWEERRGELESWFSSTPLDPSRFRLSATLDFTSWDELAAWREQSRAASMEGLMVKRRKSAYLNGRPKGHWYKWKRDPLTVDAVLLYAQRGHGKRASFYSDYTFGVWSETDEGGRELVPVGKAYSGFTDEELGRLDRWVREHTSGRFGAAVRAVEPELVLEVIFDDLRPSGRHRSGVAMRFPRIHRIRWDKPAAEADTLESLKALGRLS